MWTDLEWPGMSRGVGEFVVQDHLPEWAAPIVAVLTQLGDIWFLVTLLAILYWTQTDVRDDVALVAGMLIAGIGFYRWLKFVFEWPRPDEPLLDPELVHWLIRPVYEATAFSHSYGFPSGHATISTIVYVGLALVLPFSTRRRRLVVAGALVVFVSFTRIVLGLHYLVDVVVGAALGGLVLWLAFRGVERVSQEEHTILLFVAIALNGAYLLESGFDEQAVFTFGIALGFFGGWQLVVLARELVAVDRPSEATLFYLLLWGISTSFCPTESCVYLLM